jgi:hypothetical protein
MHSLHDPTYELHVYEVMGDDDRAFALIAVAHDDAHRLTRHPESGRPLRPLFGAPGLRFEHAPRAHEGVQCEQTIAAAIGEWFVARGDSFQRVETFVSGM